MHMDDRGVRWMWGACAFAAKGTRPHSWPGGYFGVKYKSVDIPESMPTLSDEDRMALFEVLCCFFDLSASYPKNPGEMRDAWKKAFEAQQQNSRRILVDERAFLSRFEDPAH